MNNSLYLKEIEILHEISKFSSRLPENTQPVDLLKWFLNKIFKLFSPDEKIIFSNIQYFSFTDKCAVQRLDGIPSIFNREIISQEEIFITLKNVLLFLGAAQSLNKNKHEGVANSINLFKDKFIIETVKFKSTKVIEKPLEYNSKYNILTVNIPDLYDPRISKDFFPDLDIKISNIKMSATESAGLIIDGFQFESLIKEMMTSTEIKHYFQKINVFFQSDKNQRLFQIYKEELISLNTNFEIQSDTNKLNQFIKTLLLHSWLKTFPYTYQVILTKDGPEHPLCNGALLFGASKRFSHERFNIFHIALNLAFNALSENFSIKPISKGVTSSKTFPLQQTSKIPVKQKVELPVFRDSFYGMIGHSPVMRNVFERIRKVARFDTDVLLLGESGCGKDLAARAIHALSERKDGPFISISLAERPDTLVDSELFGHEKGAFTGAVQKKNGYFERANGGTLFLDEIAHIPVNIQSKLLRVFQSREFERVGGTEIVRVNIRIISATSEDLQNKLIRENLEFLDPLYYRLERYIIVIPPLRKRKEDIPSLVYYYLNRLNNGKQITIIPKVIDFLQTLEWPGNVRQLFATLERAYINAYDDGEINEKHFEFEAMKDEPAMGLNNGLKETLKTLRENSFVIERSLKDLNQNHAFGLSRKTLIRYTRELCLLFLASNDWDLQRAIKAFAGKEELERCSAKKFKNYFIGDKRNNGLISLIKKNPVNSGNGAWMKDMFRSEFEEPLLQFQKNLQNEEISLQTWNYIFEQYHL